MTKDLFIDLNYRSGPSPSSCLHVHPNNELSNLMNNEHPITPPPKLVQQWREESSTGELHFSPQYLATQAARWSADQELDACLKWIGSFCATWTCGRRPEDVLRAARRPKPSSLKEQALGAWGRFTANEHTNADKMIQDFALIRRALEALPND